MCVGATNSSRIFLNPASRPRARHRELVSGKSAAGGGVPNYGPNDGKDIGNGRRLVEVDEVESQITAYKTVKIIDVVYQPGAGDPIPAADDKGMDVDMLCHIMAGEFTIQKKGIPAYTVKEGMLYTCGKGKTDQATNISKVVGIHRIALLIPA